MRIYGGGRGGGVRMSMTVYNYILFNEISIYILNIPMY